MKKTLFEYINYREYLRDFFAWKKSEHSFYSYRLFAQKAGLRSPNFLKLVIDGERNISKESVYKFSKAMGLNKGETDYFENMVFLDQSRTLEEKNLYLSKVMRYRIKNDPRKIEKSEFEYYSQWYHPVIRELVCAVDFCGDFTRLGSSVIPSIKAVEAQKSVELLLRLGYIEKRDGHCYVKTSMCLSTGPTVRSVAVANYHKSMMGLAAESIERFPSDKRNITSLTMTVSKKTYNTMIYKIEKLRKELLEMSESEEENLSVVQVNFQVFPLSAEAIGNQRGTK